MKILFVALAALMISVLPAIAGKRIALVIGNSNYEQVIDLKNPVNDADLMEKTLKDVGFEVTRLNDLDQRAMKTAMVEFGRKLKLGADASMFYYAGHGVELDGVNYLVPVDADTRNKEEADIQNVSVNSFLALSENSNVPLNIVILDACRNNPFRGLRTSGQGGLAPVKAPRGTYVAYATAPGAVANDGEGVNSPFTLALAESIMQPGLTLEGVLKLTRSKVQLATSGAQLPFDSSAITGDFYFVPNVTETLATEPTPAILQKDTAQEAYNAAGDDPDLLKIVVDRFGETVWAALAREKLKKLIKPTAPEIETLNVEKTDEATDIENPPAKASEFAGEEDVDPVPTKKLPVIKRDASREKVKVVRKRQPVEVKPVYKRPVREKPRTKPRVAVLPKKNVVEGPKRREAAQPRQVRSANLPFCGFSTVRAGSMCKDGNGRVCRVAFVFNGGGNRGPILRGCR